MTSHKTNWVLIGAATGACVAMSVFTLGCESEPPPPPPVAQAPPPPPPPPPKPALTSIEDLMAQYHIDPRVHLPEEKAPDNDPDRIAVLQFFDGFARGDEKAVGSMLAATDRLQLEDLVKSGQWKSACGSISLIEVQTGPSPDGRNCALAVITLGSSFQPQLWYYASDEDKYTYEAAPTPPGILDKLSGADWIAAWHRIIEEELALADKPDEDIVAPQRENSGEGESTSSGGGAPKGPVGPGVGRKKPTGPPTKPFKPGGPGGR
jgi:hypothetical protein